IRNVQNRWDQACHTFDDNVKAIRDKANPIIEDAFRQWNAAREKFNTAVADFQNTAEKAIADAESHWEAERDRLNQAIDALKEKIHQLDLSPDTVKRIIARVVGERL